ncbi:MAG: hypothetical protein ACI3XS_01285 [Eubacteriales bacterium]
MRYFDFDRRRLAWKNHISGAPSTVSGTGSVMLNATSGSRISALEIEGNTYQETSAIEQPVSAADFIPTGSDYIAYYVTTGQFTALQEWATENSYSGDFNLSVSKEGTDEIPTGFAVIVGNSLDDILTGSNTTTIYYKSDIEGNDTATINLSDTVYVGIGNTNEGVGDNASEYLDLFLSNFTFCIQPTGQEVTPSPESPSAVKSSNDSTTVITLQGKNLIKYPYYDAAETVNGVTFTYNHDGSIAIKGTATANAYRRINRNLQLDGGSYTLSGGTAGVIVNCFKDNAWFGQSTSTGDFSFTIADGGESLDTVSVYVNSGTTVDTTIYPQIEKGNIATAYEPYFNKTVSIPSSVTLSDGASLAMNLAKVGNKADKLNLKGARVIYSQNTERITLTGEESGWSETDGKYKYSPGKTLIANSGYCTHFILSGTGENNTFGVKNDGITFKTDIADSLENFKVWLKAQSDTGNAVQVTVALASPVEYDITKTDFAKELLNFETSRGYNLTLKAEADIAPSSIVCEYYSLENEDKQTVTVRCEKADGTPLCEPYLHEVRKSTLYTVKAPEIDGYVSEKESKSADASFTTEIKFIYTEAAK